MSVRGGVLRVRVGRGLRALVLAGGVFALSVASASASVDHELVGSFGPGGPGSGVFSSVQGVAVEQSSGDVYVLRCGRREGL